MNIQKIIIFIKGIEKISAPDPDNAVETIIDSVLRKNILFFDNLTPIIKLPVHYQRISNIEVEVLIFNLLDSKAQITVSNLQINEAIKRIRFSPHLQIDLTEEFWKGQGYVNLVNGVYEVYKQRLLPIRNEYKFDYLVNIRYMPHCKLEDAPVFKIRGKQYRHGAV